MHVLSFPAGVALSYYFTTAIQILRHVQTPKKEGRFCTFSDVSGDFESCTCRRRGHLRHVGPQSREPLPPPLFYTGYTLPCAARTCAHHERKRRSLMKRQW